MFPPSNNTVKVPVRKNPWFLAGLACLVMALIALTLFLRSGGTDRKNDSRHEITSTHSKEKHRPNNGSDFNSPGEDGPAGAKTTTSNKTDTAPATPNTGRPSDTRASHRDTVLNAKGERKTVIDPMASWEHTPPWPEGPRLLAEVETSARRYVNLRPDDAGDLPRIYADAEERIELEVSFPDGEPGEKIYVELPNGGSFPDTDQYGRVFELPEDRTLSFSYISDESRGHCNVMLRHRGHSRSLPIWVGAPPEPGS